MCYTINMFVYAYTYIYTHICTYTCIYILYIIFSALHFVHSMCVSLGFSSNSQYTCRQYKWSSSSAIFPFLPLKIILACHCTHKFM